MVRTADDIFAGLFDDCLHLSMNKVRVSAVSAPHMQFEPLLLYSESLYRRLMAERSGLDSGDS